MPIWTILLEENELCTAFLGAVHQLSEGSKLAKFAILKVLGNQEIFLANPQPSCIGLFKPIVTIQPGSSILYYLLAACAWPCLLNKADDLRMLYVISQAGQGT